MNARVYRHVLCTMLIVICILLYETVFIKINFANEAAVSYNVAEEPKLNKQEDISDISDTEDTDNSVHMVMPSGKPIGIYVKTEGVMVIGTGQIKAKTGESCSPCDNKIQSGDYIMGINGIEVDDKEELISIVDEYGGSALDITIKRNGELMNVNVTPVLSINDKYMLGVWVKDDISGIGTLTYIDEDGFGALGHSINDNDTGELMEVADGAIYNTRIINIVRTDGKNPGRIEGLIDYSSSNVIGRVNNNTSYGIRGYMTRNAEDYIASGEWMPIGKKTETHLGSALLLSAVSGEPKYYEIEITGIDISENSDNKGLEIKIIDEELLNLTNGIVQGMSGTPIIQDGKLVGAVTHVFLKDATRGYGAFVEDMLK